MDNNYDAIIIGSGIGSLTTAAILSKFNHKRVLILEKRFNGGGQTQAFQRKGKYSWDVGLQYVGEMEPGELGRVPFDYITNSALKWRKIKGTLEKHIFPDFSFKLSGEKDKSIEELIKLYPMESKSIKRYFKDVHKVNLWTLRHFLIQVFPFPLSAIIGFINLFERKKSTITTQEYIDKNFKSEKLKAILTAAWGTFGLPPEKSAFAIHSTIYNHFVNGGFYPEGGSSEILNNILPLIEQNGGSLLTNREVTRVVINNDRAVGVECINSTSGDSELFTYSAPVIISGTGVEDTYMNLLPEKICRKQLKQLKLFEPGCSSLSLYLALDSIPDGCDINEENHWIFNSQDMNSVFRQKDSSFEGVINHAWLSFPSVKDREEKELTAIVICFVDYSKYKKWADQKWFARDSEYKELKSSISESIISFIETIYPGFSEKIVYSELSTPLTMEYFTGKSKGAMYGIPATPDRFRSKLIKAKTSVKGLYITGCDAFCAGVVGSLWGGIMAPIKLNGYFGIIKILKAMGYSIFKLIFYLFGFRKRL